MNPKSVELLADHPVHGVKGKKFELAESEATVLAAAGILKICDPDPTQTIADTITTTVIGAVDKRLDDRFKTFEETQSKALVKSFGGLHNPAQAKDAAEEAMFGFKNMGEFFDAVKKGSPPREGAPAPSHADERLLKAASGLNTNVGVDGGFLVPESFSNRVLEHAWKESPLVSMCDQFSFTSASMEFTALKESSRATGSRRGGVRAYWLSEAEQFTASKPTFRKFRLTPHKLGVFCFATEEQMQDTGFGYNLESKLAQYAGEEIRFFIADAVYRGDGVGKPLGILNAPATIAVAAEGGQTADTINWLNIQNMYVRMLPDSLNSAVWITNINCFTQFLNLKWPDASGTLPIWIPGAQFPNVSTAPAGTLLGRPLYILEHASSIGDLGDFAFVDLKHYLLGTKGGVNSAMSIHLRFDYEEVCWRFSFRVDGQPWLESAITPYKGSATLSPFVTLAAR